MKEQEHSPEELNEMELSHSSDVELRIMVAKTLSSARKDGNYEKRPVGNEERQSADKEHAGRNTRQIRESRDRIRDSERTSALVWAFAWELALSPASPSNTASVYSPPSVLSKVDKLPPHRNAHTCARMCVCV